VVRLRVSIINSLLEHEELLTAKNEQVFLHYVLRPVCGSALLYMK